MSMDLMQLVEREDWYGLMVRAGRLWLGRDHPAALRAVVYVIEGEDETPTRIVITNRVGADV